MNAPIAALRRRPRDEVAQNRSRSSETKPPIWTAAPRLESITLLSEVMARLHGVNMPVVQFIRASGETSASDVASRFAEAAAMYVGRTLLIRVQVPEPPRAPCAETAVSVATIPRRRPRKSVDAFEIIPDSLLPGLCHARLSFEFGRASHVTQVLPDALLEGVSFDFRLIAIESDAPERCPLTLDLATRCHGSVLVITAGVTSLPQARRVLRQVQLAGGTLLGSVLHGAPQVPRLQMPLWLRRIKRTSTR